MTDVKKKRERIDTSNVSIHDDYYNTRLILVVLQCLRPVELILIFNKMQIERHQTIIINIAIEIAILISRKVMKRDIMSIFWNITVH